MKKLALASLVALLSLSLALPALADENKGNQANKENKDKGKSVSTVVYQPRAVTVRGSITAISATTLPADITVKLEKITPKQLKNYPSTFPVLGNTLVAHLTADTKIVRKYAGKANFSELAVGDQVEITGKLQTDGTVLATRVKDNAIHVTFNAKKGAVTAIDATAKTFTIKNNNKEFKIFVTADTKFAKAGVTAPTLADLKVGDEVVVRGVVRQAVNEVTADSVVIKIGEKERLVKQLETQKLSLEKKIEAVKANLTKIQAELEVLIKKLSEATAVAPVTPATTTP